MVKMAHNSNFTSEEREIHLLRCKIDKFTRTIIKCLTDHVRRNVPCNIIIKQILKICLHYGSQVFPCNCKRIKRRSYEKKAKDYCKKLSPICLKNRSLNIVVNGIVTEVLLDTGVPV